MSDRGNVARAAVVAALVFGLIACSGGHHRPSAAAQASTTTSAGGLAPGTTARTAPPTTAAPAASGPPGGPVPAGFQPSSVTFVSADVGWALGDAPCGRPTCTSLVRTRDGGRSWQGVPAPVAPFDATPGRLGGASGVDGVRFADPADGWSFGSQVWATHDGGSSWRQVQLPDLAPGAEVADLEAGEGVVLAAVARVGGGPVVLVRADAHSDTWSIVATATSQASPRLVLSRSAGWLVLSSAATGGPPWLTSADIASGVPWAAANGPCGATSSGGTVAVAPDGAVAVVCAGPAGAGQEEKPVFTAPTGSAFVAAGAAPVEGDLESVAAASPSVLVVAAASGASELYRTADGGRTWVTVFRAATGGIPFQDLGFTTASQGVAILGVPTAVGAPAAGVPPSTLLMTRDGGRTWSAVPFQGAPD